MGKRKATIEGALEESALRRRIAGRWFLGFNDAGFTSELRGLLDELFPEKCPFEEGGSQDRRQRGARITKPIRRGDRLRAAIVSPCLNHGGTERWALTLAKYCQGIDWAACFWTKPGFRPCTHEVGDMLAAMDAFLLGSPSEGFCLTILEAMYAGVPVVASPVGALAHELATSLPVYWPIPVDAAPEVAARVIRDAVEHAPAETRVRTALAREIVAREFTGEQMAEKWAEYLRGVVAAQKRTSIPVSSNE